MCLPATSLHYCQHPRTAPGDQKQNALPIPGQVCETLTLFLQSKLQISDFVVHRGPETFVKVARSVLVENEPAVWGVGGRRLIRELLANILGHGLHWVALLRPTTQVPHKVLELSDASGQRISGGGRPSVHQAA
jgi:hypothetical protein